MNEGRQLLGGVAEIGGEMQGGSEYEAFYFNLGNPGLIYLFLISSSLLKLLFFLKREKRWRDRNIYVSEKQ